MPFAIFDEPALLTRLRSLPAADRALFAAEAAERALVGYGVRWPDSRATIPVLRAALDCLWRDLGTAPPADELESQLARCTALVEPEDQQVEQERQHADDVVAAVCYALQARLTGDPQAAAWAARRTYETLDAYVLQSEEDIDLNLPGSGERVLHHPVVQAELERQLRDLGQLEAQPGIGAPNVLIEHHDRAVLEGARFFAPLN